MCLIHQKTMLSLEHWGSQPVGRELYPALRRLRLQLLVESSVRR